MGGKFWSWCLANKVRAHLASFLIGMLTVLVTGLMGVGFWSLYLPNKDNVVPLLGPLASLLTGVLTVIVAGFAARIALQQAETARLRHEEQTKADLQRRITESFTKAIEQLGSDKLQVRLGGIYTLERIARESEFDYWPIMETLTAFVRESPHREDDASAVPQPSPSKSPTDVQAVLTVIKRRDAKNREREQIEGWRLDLRLADLRGADLIETHLEGANLRGAHLEQADLTKAHLEDANLRRAHLEQADLTEAHLEGADLRGAHLEQAHLRGAHLEGADLWRAHLEGADLGGAHLERANLGEAHLEGANLWGAHLEGANLDKAHHDQIDKAFGDAETRLPEGLTRPAHWLPKQVTEFCHQAQRMHMPLNVCVTFRAPKGVSDAKGKRIISRRIAHLGQKLKQHGQEHIGVTIYEKHPYLHAHQLVHVRPKNMDLIMDWREGETGDVHVGKADRYAPIYVTKQRKWLGPEIEAKIATQKGRRPWKKGAYIVGPRLSFTRKAKAVMASRADCAAATAPIDVPATLQVKNSYQTNDT